MDSKMQTETDQHQTYVAPVVSDYGTLQDLTEKGGTVAPSDVPHGHTPSAYPYS